MSACLPKSPQEYRSKTLFSRQCNRADLQGPVDQVLLVSPIPTALRLFCGLIIISTRLIQLLYLALNKNKSTWLSGSCYFHLSAQHPINSLIFCFVSLASFVICRCHVINHLTKHACIANLLNTIYVHHSSFGHPYATQHSIL